jgi:hypothetical protein
MYLQKSKIIEAFLRLVIIRSIFFTKVESLREQDEYDDDVNDEDSDDGIIEYFSP